MTADLLRFAAGAALASLPGFSAMRGWPRAGPATRAGRIALAFALGLAIAVPACLAAALLGIPLRGRVIAAICVLLALAIRLLTRRAIPEARSTTPPPATGTAAASRALLAGCAALFLVKVALVPVWSWDYYAVHGTKARRIFAGARLDLGGLKAPSLSMSHPDYPLGGPIAWRLLELGDVPGVRWIKLAHALLALALLALVREGILAAGRSEAAANTGAAFAAISPLLWDTESLGLMEVPFALFLAASFYLHLAAPFRSRLAALRDPAPPGWIRGAIAGFLPWIKLREGLSLLLFLAAAELLSRRNREQAGSRFAGPLTAAFLWAASAASVSIFLLPPGERFLAGDWISRGLARAAHPGPILAQLARELKAREWLGFWVVFAAGWIFSIIRRRRTAALLASVVAAQLATYASVYFFTYLDPVAHIRSSFFRISGALLPAALIALAAKDEGAGDSEPLRTP